MGNEGVIMDQFYHQLNQSHKNLNQDDYKKQTTNLMTDTLKHQDVYENILVIGAGNLSDISIDFLLKKFNHIILTDIDDKSMNEALKDKKDHAKIKVIQMDYLGLSEIHFFNAFFDSLRTKSRRQIEVWIDQKIKKILNYHFSKKFDITFDVIYIAPIYTQLLYREVEHKLNQLVLKGLSLEMKDFILSYLLQKMIEIFHAFNEEIIKLLKPDGHIFVASDIFYLTDNDFSTHVKKHINNQKLMDEIYQSYQHQYGMGLGDYGLNHLSSLFHKVKKTWLLWGMTSHQAYAVQFCILKTLK